MPGSRLTAAQAATPQQIAVAIARFAFKDYYERDRSQFTLLANVEAFLSDPANWDPNDPESPAALAREVARRAFEDPPLSRDAGDRVETPEEAS